MTRSPASPAMSPAAHGPTGKSRGNRLHDAVAAGDIGLVRRFLADGDAPNERGENDELPLHLLPAGRNPRTIDDALAIAGLLLDHGADPALESNGEPLLHRALFAHGPEMLRLLIARGAPLHRIDKEGFDALQTATVHEKEPEAAVLLDLGANPLAPVLNTGFVSFHLACQTAHPGIVALHLARDVNPDLPARDGRTGLWFAARRFVEAGGPGPLEAVKHLVAAGADPFRTVSGQPTPRDILGQRLSAHEILDLIAEHAPLPAQTDAGHGNHRHRRSR